ncbi:MAG TPA: hypothetical protein VII56_04160 [Rhizomicrobium sp.]
MKRVVFYSWQSDLPNATNRGFIQQSLEIAAGQIAADKSVEIEPVIDRDTQGVSGSPDISATIFAKIATADVFVADVSIIAKPRKGRPTPNPNVMIELGYALRARGPDKVLMVFNEAYGKISDLPFDLKMRRIIAYNEPEKNADRATGRKALAGKLEAALRTALATGEEEAEPSLVGPALVAIENAEPKRILLLRRALGDILARLDAKQPKMPRVGGTIDDLLKALNESQEAVADVARLSETVAVMSDQDAALEIYRWFGAVLERYDLPRNFSGQYNNADFDYFKFLGYEMFTGLVAVLVREGRWTLLQHLLGEPIPVKYVRRSEGPGSVMWDRLSDYPPMLWGYGEQKGRLSFQADLIQARHTKGAPATAVSFDDFVEADYLLYLRTWGALSPNNGQHWRPWCFPYLEHVPMFLRVAERKSVATQLAKTLGASDNKDLKELIVKSFPTLRQMFQRGFLRAALEQKDIDRIGSLD